MIVFSFITFILLCLCFFTLPGIFLLSKIHSQLSFGTKLILGTVIGLTVFTLLSYTLLALSQPFLIIFLPLLILALFIRKSPKMPKSISSTKLKQLIIILVIFSIGVTGQMLIIFPSGQILNGDLVFYSAHGHDGSWHIALMEELKKGYPWQNPVFAGEKLVNYHFFSDIAPTMFSLVPNLNGFDLYFKFFPFLYALLLGGMAFLVGQKLGGNFASGIWATIFTYFCGSFGYIFTWWQNHSISGESLFWATQIQSSSGNPPQIAALILVLAFVYCFSFFLSQKNWVTYLICIILAGSLIVFKVYGGVIILGSLTIVGFWQFIKDRNFSILILLFFSVLLSFILYFPNTKSSVSFLILEPWWFIRTMVVATNRLNWLDLELQRQTYIAEGNWKRVIQVETIAFLIFFVGNLGMRIIGIPQLIRMTKTFFNNYLNQLVLLILLISFVLPLLFLQKGVASNTIQFLQYYLLIFGILAGITVAKILSQLRFMPLKIIFTILVIALAVPTQLGLVYDFYKNPPIAKVGAQEIQALQYLKQNSDNQTVILTPPYNRDLNLHLATPPIWAWFDTAYVSAISGRRSYFADYEQVDIMGYDFKQRQQVQKNIFLEENPQLFMNLLKTNQIGYLYFPKFLSPKVDLGKTGLKPVYRNEEVEIWQII